MRILATILVGIMLFAFTVSSFGVELTKEQFENYAYIDKYLRDKYPTYTGMVGERENITALGISEYTFNMELHSIDIDQLKESDKRAKAVKKLRNKLKGLGLDSGDLEILGLTNVIPD